MRLVAVYNVWGDEQLLNLSIKNIRPLVDGIIVIYSTVSNYGEAIFDFNFHEDIDYFKFTPILSSTPMANETAKRNAGLNKAREKGYTHFIMMDADEFYEPQEFLKGKRRFEVDDLSGLVCRTKVYFRSPKLTIGYDTTLVPFIHKITDGLKFEFNKNYPFAWTDTDGVPFTPNRRIRIDPTRSMNISSDVFWSGITMHHFSWVRSDIQKKIRNSTARQNIERSTIIADYCNAKAGYYCEFYKTRLEACDNLFHIPEITDGNISTPYTTGKPDTSGSNPGPNRPLEGYNNPLR